MYMYTYHCVRLQRQRLTDCTREQLKGFKKGMCGKGKELQTQPRMNI